MSADTLRAWWLLVWCRTKQPLTHIAAHHAHGTHAAQGPLTPCNTCRAERPLAIPCCARSWHSLRSLSCPLSQRQTDYYPGRWTATRRRHGTVHQQPRRSGSGPRLSGGGAASGSDFGWRHACPVELLSAWQRVQREHQRCLSRSRSLSVLFRRRISYELVNLSLSVHKRDIHT